MNIFETAQSIMMEASHISRIHFFLEGQQVFVFPYTDEESFRYSMEQSLISSGIVKKEILPKCHFINITPHHQEIWRWGSERFELVEIK